MKKFLAVLGTILMLSTVLTGCMGSKFEPDQSCLYIQKDGGVIGYTKEEGFDRNYYDLDELRTEFVEPAVMEYNTAAAGLSFVSKEDTKELLPISIERLELVEGVAEMMLEYASPEDYMAFNANQYDEDQRLVIGKVADGALSSQISWVSAKDGAPADSTAALKNQKNGYAEIDFAARVQFEGKILYASDNVMILDSYTVGVDGKEPAYVIFKK